jgi:heavy metal sensor kinase
VRFRPRHIRTSLTLWYVMMFGAGLILYICCATLLQFWQLRNQLYHAEVQDIETAEGLLYLRPDGSVAMREDYHNHPESLLLLDRLMEVLAPDGTVLYRNDRLGGRDLGGKRFPGEGETSYNERSVRLTDGTGALMISHVHSIDGRSLLIRLGYSVAHLQYRMKEFTGLLLLALPFALAAVGFTAYSLTRRALDPLASMAKQAEQITPSRLQERLPIENPDDELGHIARVFNGLLGRLENSFEQLRRFTSDASHELRTPLAALQSVGEMGLQKEYSVAEYRDILGSMLEEVTRLTRMVESLLTISRADAGEVRLQTSVFSLVDLVHEAIGLVDILADERGQRFTVTTSKDYLVRADRLLLRQAILNVLHNAVKYSPVGGEIRITLSQEAEGGATNPCLTVEIIDEGPGIPEEQQAKVFDRFYRVDQGRSRETGGAGLGLAIAKWAVQVNGGEIGVKTSPMGGCNFFIRMPCHHFPEEKEKQLRDQLTQ